MNQSSSQGHDGQDKVRGCGRDMDRKVQQMSQCRNVDKTTAHSQKTRDKPYKDANYDAEPKIEGIIIASAFRINEVTFCQARVGFVSNRGVISTCRVFLPRGQPKNYCRDEHQDTKY